jgi:hypothetical protein
LQVIGRVEGERQILSDVDHRIASGQYRAAGQEHDDQRGSGSQPDAGHGGRHGELSLPQVAPEAEEASHRQQHEGGGDERDHVLQAVRAIDGGAGDIQLSQSKDGQGAEGKIDDPNAVRVGSPPVIAPLFPHRLWRFFSFIVRLRRGGAEVEVGFDGGVAITVVVQSGRLQEPFAGSILRLVDHRTVPGQLMRAEPDERDDGRAEQRSSDELRNRQPCRDRQRQSEADGPLRAFLDRDAADPDGAHHEATDDPFQTCAK